MKIAPSILDANWQNLQSEIDSVSTVDRIHLDIMDGHYVPNLSFGSPALKHINWPVEIEAHLMVNNPAAFFDMYIGIGCTTITFHIENTGTAEAVKLLNQLKNQGVKAGVTVDGYTEVQFLNQEILKTADQILLMSVKAGFGGQSFMEQVVDKIKWLRANGFTGEIEIDGGVNLENAPLLKEAGADICVVGSALMKLSVAERAVFIEKFQAV